MNCPIFIARDKIAFESKRLEKLPESLRVRPLAVIVFLELLGHKTVNWSLQIISFFLSRGGGGEGGRGGMGISNYHVKL